MEKKCPYCGKLYKKSELREEFKKNLPEIILQNIEYVPDCNCFEKIKEKERQEQEKKWAFEALKNKIKKYKDISLVDSKFLNSKFENAEIKESHMLISKKYAEKFIESKKAPQGIMLYGTVGTGKTFASACISNYLMEHGKTVLVMNLGLYINKIQREWAEAENSVLEYVKNCDLLVIDDFGVEKVSEFVIDKTFALIDTRYRAEKPMIITSNLNLESINKKFGSRISDRISEMCYQLAVVGESKRKCDKESFLKFIA